jgi:hypothetical protein
MDCMMIPKHGIVCNLTDLVSFVPKFRGHAQCLAPSSVEVHWKKEVISLIYPSAF